MLEIRSNGSKYYFEEPDTIEDLLQVLTKETLDPTIEKYRNFVNPHPNWLGKEAKEKYKNCTQIFGNFATRSHVFNIITDEVDIILKLTEAINNNKNTDAYVSLKNKVRS